MKINALKVGIAGYGIVGQRRHQFIDLNPHFELVAVSDQKYSTKGTFDNGIRYYPDFELLLDSEDLDVLFVCLPNYLASKATVMGLELNMHVFCEKPPGRTLDEIAKVIHVARKHPHLKLKYGFNHRYHESVKQAYSITKSKELGPILNMRGVYGKSVMINFEKDWRTKRDIAGGGILLDQGIHMIDLMRFMAGDFETVMSFVSNDFWHHDVEDNAYALMKSKSGVVAMLHSSATQWRHRFSLEIAYEKGLVNLSGILSGTKSYGAETITVSYRGASDKGDPKEITTRFNEDNSWRDEINDFADCIVSDRAVIIGTAYDAYKSMELVFKIYCADLQWKERYNITDQPILISNEGNLSETETGRIYEEIP